MGRILTIRLSAVTYNEDEVFRAWPNLCSLAWPGKGDIDGDRWRKKPTAFASPISPEKERHGTMDLVHELVEEWRFGDWPSERKDRFEPLLTDLEAAGKRLETALGDWQPQPANAATNDIEDILDKLEKLALPGN